MTENKKENGDSSAWMRTLRVVSILSKAKSVPGCDFDAWERDFRVAAKADDCRIFRDHLRRLKLPNEPLLLLDGTIRFVGMRAKLFSAEHTDGFLDLLKKQTYNPADAAR